MVLMVVGFHPPAPEQAEIIGLVGGQDLPCDGVIGELIVSVVASVVDRSVVTSCSIGNGQVGGIVGAGCGGVAQGLDLIGLIGRQEALGSFEVLSGFPIESHFPKAYTA